jgi:hypothetical protein
VDFNLSVAPQNRRREVGAGHVLRSSGFLYVEASLVNVSLSDLKIGGGTTAGGAGGTSQMLHRRQVEDGRFDVTGCVRPCYSNFIVFNVLDPMDIVVI